jgi:hypothetical protein
MMRDWPCSPDNPLSSLSCLIFFFSPFSLPPLRLTTHSYGRRGSKKKDRPWFSCKVTVRGGAKARLAL